MSELTEGLERIYAWLAKNKPEEVSRLRAGLSRDEIDEKVKDLPFKLPEEIDELYQWHDGTVDQFLFTRYNFLPLQAAISAYREQMGEIRYYESQEAHFFQYSLPVFELWYQRDVLYTVIASEQGYSSVWIYDPECRDYSLRYKNLTALVLHGAEWCDLAQYYEQHGVWEVEAKTDCLLDTKYMAREYILDSVARKRCSNVCLDIYRNFLNE